MNSWSWLARPGEKTQNCKMFLTSSVFHEITLSANRKTNHSLNVELQVNSHTKFHVDKLILKTKPNPEKKWLTRLKRAKGWLNSKNEKQVFDYWGQRKAKFSFMKVLFLGRISVSCLDAFLSKWRYFGVEFQRVELHFGHPRLKLLRRKN